MSIAITINQSAIDALKRPGGAIYDDMGRRALNADSAAKMAAPVRTGRLRASGYATPSTEGDGAWDVIFPVNYAGFVDQGTRYMLGRPFLSSVALQAALQ